MGGSRFLTPIRKGASIGHDWRGDFVRVLDAEHGITLTSYGSIEASEVLSAWSFRPLDGPAPLHPCPFLGPVVGFVHLEFEQSAPDSFRGLALGVSRLGGGPIRREDGAILEPVRRRSFPLTDLLDAYGFDQGAALLSRDAAYIEHIHAAVTLALAGRGLRCDGLAYVGDNPVRLMINLEFPGRRSWVGLWREGEGGLREGVGGEAEARGALDGGEVTFWAFDFQAIEDPAFWGVVE
jgi:hypothetical protein